MKCSVCGHEWRAGSTACPRCGAPTAGEAISGSVDERTVMRSAYTLPSTAPEPHAEQAAPAGLPSFAAAPEPPTPFVAPTPIGPATSGYAVPPIPQAAASWSPPPFQATAGQLPPAPVGTRFAAHILDSLVMTGAVIALYVVSLILSFLASSVSRISYDLATLAAALIALLTLAAYAVVVVGYVIWGWGNGQTVGKRAMKIAVVDARTGGPIGYSRAIVRYLMMVVMGLPCYVGYFSILASDGRGWHDKAADSRVVVCPEWPAPVLPWKR